MSPDKNHLDGVNLLLGVSAGISAYKSVELASKLTAAGASVRTVMTENACRLVGPKSFEALTGNPVYIDMFSAPDEYKIGHVSLADWADIILVAPATADVISKTANGICDDLLTTLLCVGWRKKIFMAPAMNNNMWENPALQRNIEKIKSLGVELIGPQIGRLACGSEGIGRMTQAGEIIEAIKLSLDK